MYIMRSVITVFSCGPRRPRYNGVAVQQMYHIYVSQAMVFTAHISIQAFWKARDIIHSQFMAPMSRVKTQTQSAIYSLVLCIGKDFIILYLHHNHHHHHHCCHSHHHQQQQHNHHHHQQHIIIIMVVIINIFTTVITIF